MDDDSGSRPHQPPTPDDVNERKHSCSSPCQLVIESGAVYAMDQQSLALAASRNGMLSREVALGVQSTTGN